MARPYLVIGGDLAGTAASPVSMQSWAPGSFTLTAGRYIQAYDYVELGTDESLTMESTAALIIYNTIG